MKYAVCAFLLFALPAFATISQRQSPVSTWNGSSSTSCFNTLGSAYHSGDLIVVWRVAHSTAFVAVEWGV